MLSWIFQQTVISLVIIVLIHSIYKFLQNNLTTPKIRDLVEKPTKQYQEIYDAFKSKPKQQDNIQASNNNMKNELQNYLKELSKTNEIPNNAGMNNTNASNNIPEAMSFSDNFSSSYETF